MSTKKRTTKKTAAKNTVTLPDLDRFPKKIRKKLAKLSKKIEKTAARGEKLAKKLTKLNDARVKLVKEGKDILRKEGGD